jgi:hypothetical protein
MATATVVGDRQEYTFQAEIKQFLHLSSHSLYQSREIAVRELISNSTRPGTGFVGMLAARPKSLHRSSGVGGYRLGR